MTVIKKFSNITNWKVENKENLSFHQNITYDIQEVPKQKEQNGWR